jgi:DNA repair exonuclease SbcCD nuclease subunit
MSDRASKSSILWNVVEPGDPYDIKKSMIARLPDHPTTPMGSHLELVCLLQAAEIERLTDFLTENKAKYREVERRELDRHSYEIQIKELAERNVLSNNLKSENDRLKDFIRRQTQELEELQKQNLQAMNMEALQSKYEGVLNELRISRDQNEASQTSISRLNLEISEWRSKWEHSQRDKLSIRSQVEVDIR